jgi:ribosomal protein S18 acetylase RimI-like enzyme
MKLESPGKPMIYSIATGDDVLELASFARSTYEVAFGGDIKKAQLRAHLEARMSDTEFAEMMKSDLFHIAVDNESLVGFAQIGIVDPAYEKYLQSFDPQDSEIRRLYVLESHQGQGIGSSLVERTLQDPMVAQTHAVYLTTWETNYGAQKLYRNHGFTEVAKIPEYATDGKIDGYEHIMVRSV